MGQVLFQNGIRHNLNVCRPLASKVEKSYLFHNFTINTTRLHIGKRTRRPKIGRYNQLDEQHRQIRRWHRLFKTGLAHSHFYVTQPNLT